MPRYQAHDLDMELVFDRFLGTDEFEILQSLVRDLLPAHSSSSTAGDVIVLVRGDDPRAWASTASLEAERLIIDRLGADLFFDRNEPDRTGRAPDWSALPRAVDAGEG